jgi:Spy/CpxP family protein refolding chaperone
MSSSQFARYLASTMVLTISALLVQSGTAAAQETPKTTPPAAKAKADGKKADKTPGRLPAYYKGVVTDEQRQQIYKIMAEYAPKLADLRAQLNRATKEQDGKIEALLTPEQKQKITQLKAAAKVNRRAAAGGEKKAQANAPAAPPAKSAVQPETPAEPKK